MKFENINFLVSASNLSNCPKLDLKEIVILGRSNVGKSTFINLISNKKDLAKTSKTPGRTRLLNYFNVSNKYYLVDAPGYGYAQVDKSMDIDFSSLMEDYLDKRENLVGAILLLDSRRIPNEDDKLIFDYLISHNKKILIVATKFDKLNQSERALCDRNIQKAFNTNIDLNIVHSRIDRLDFVETIYQRLDDIIK